MNLKIGHVLVQGIFWNPLDPEERERMAWGYKRWPHPRVRERMVQFGHPNYGFHAICAGPCEVRYWPAHTNGHRGGET